MSYCVVTLTPDGGSVGIDRYDHIALEIERWLDVATVRHITFTTTDNCVYIYTKET